MMPYTLGKVNDILVNFEDILDFLGILMGLIFNDG